MKFSIGISIIELYEEVLIWLPVIIVLDTHIECLAEFTIKFNDSVKWYIIFVSFSITIDSGCTHGTVSFFLIYHNNCEFSR